MAPRFNNLSVASLQSLKPCGELIKFFGLSNCKTDLSNSIWSPSVQFKTKLSVIFCHSLAKNLNLPAFVNTFGINGDNPPASEASSAGTDMAVDTTSSKHWARSVLPCTLILNSPSLPIASWRMRPLSFPGSQFSKGSSLAAVSILFLLPPLQ